ncbi:MAG: zinc-binding dehydrogenase [Candidatus Thermoplasmatota archaeon]|nr:zinc-binding dehydrogenase [Candidatus Thermoplasmatota archaeon]
MRAAVFHGGKTLSVEEVDRPKPAHDEVLVRVAACGICRTDLHYLHGVPTFKEPPLILGHEISGTVEEAPHGGPEIGQRVLIPPVIPCGECEYCLQGRGTLCTHMVMLGNHRDGGFAEYVAVSQSVTFPLPDTVPLQEGCIISDAFSTPYHAVINRAEVKPGQTVAIFGCGGVGLAAVQMAVLAGARVVAVDLVEEKLLLAEDFGAWLTINASGVDDAAKEVRRLTSGGADVALEVIGNPATIRQAFDSLRWGGRLMVVGYTDKEVSFSGAKLMFREMEVRGSLGCGLHDFPKVIDLAAMGLLKVKEMVSHRFALEDINEGFRLLETGDPGLLRGIVLL